MVGAIEIKLAAKLKTKYDRSPLFSVLIYHFDLLGRFIISRLEDIYLMTCWKVRRVLLVLQRRVLKNRRRLSSRHKDTIWVLSIVDINTYMIFLSFPFFFLFIYQRQPRPRGRRHTMDGEYVWIYRCSFPYRIGWGGMVSEVFSNWSTESATTANCNYFCSWKQWKRMVKWVVAAN